MKISSNLIASGEVYHATLSTMNNEHSLILASKENGGGCRANGGELMCLALAACYCNDIYREVASLNIEVLSVEVEVISEFGGIGEAAKSICYTPTVEGRASTEEITALILHTDKVAEIHNTIRKGMVVELAGMNPVSVGAL
jgi:uncharacterized OsmC-like protein